jgi:serine/threonine protein phosphatase PrpC
LKILKEKKELSITYYGASDIGLVRTENQDCFGKFPNDNTNFYKPKGALFIVADGMGGHAGGKEASKLAVDVVSDEYYSSTSDVVTNALLYAFKSANLKIHQSSMDSFQFQKKGTTCSTLVLADDQAHIAHVGDSRIYKIADGNIIQFTNDHTEVGEMFRKGILTEAEAKNHPSKSVLVRAMGIEADIEVDLIENISINHGDNFVLCSDGLAKVDAEEIKQTVLNNSAEEACKMLFEEGEKEIEDYNGRKITAMNIAEIFLDDFRSKKPATKKEMYKFSGTIEGEPDDLDEEFYDRDGNIDYKKYFKAYKKFVKEEVDSLIKEYPSYVFYMLTYSDHGNTAFMEHVIWGSVKAPFLYANNH